MKRSVIVTLFSFVVFDLTIAQVSIINQGVTPAEAKQWILFLASDEMRGRANGSPEINIAASWIMEKFRENNLQPLLNNGEFFQDYTFTSRQRTVNGRNVIGILPGTDPALKDQYIVLSAHFDHIGIRSGAGSDSICNGADDNASGICTLIGIASDMRKSGFKPGRSVIFAAFSGEEMGIRGSRYFVSNPPVPLKNIFVNINFEMIGHSELLGKDRYYMTGCSLSDLDNVINEYNRQTKFLLVDTVSVASRLFYSSDNIAFSMISKTESTATGIPSGTFATTTMAPYIHTQRDEASLFDFENMARLINHFTDIVLFLSKYDKDIVWTTGAFKRPE